MSDIPLEHVHVEPSEPNDGPAPAVVLLHGRGSDEQDLLSIAQEFPDRVHVMSLRALNRLQGGYAWYELNLSGGSLHESQPHTEQFERSRDLVRGAIAGAAGAYDIDPDQIGLLGPSQDAITSLSFLLGDPDDYAWVITLRGYLTDSHADLDPDGIAGKPVFVSDGSMDQTIPTLQVERAAERLRELDADVTTNVYNAPHGASPDELQDVVAFIDIHV